MMNEVIKPKFVIFFISETVRAKKPETKVRVVKVMDPPTSLKVASIDFLI